MISIIAAVGKNLELGKDNDLIWHFKGDLKNFKRLTMGKKIVMGAKTYLSLPKHLDGRYYIVLSKTLKDLDNVMIFNDFDSLLDYVKSLEEEVMIIGGSSIYKLFIPYADNLYLTEINAAAPADVYFPEFNKSNFDLETYDELEENDISYKLVRYRRKNER